MVSSEQSGSVTADERAALDQLYTDFEASNLAPLWTQREGLMPKVPQPDARPGVWRWSNLHKLAARSGELVPVGRGGERRAIALANPGLPGTAYATPTLWAAIQYLGPGEEAPSHRHSQSAFRFVIEGEGVWTNVDDDPVAMRRGDLLLTPGMRWHEHHNTTDQPMAWIDGLDIPLVRQLDAGFFELGPDTLSTRDTPSHSRNERLWGHAGLVPVGAPRPKASPLMAYRWAPTDAALTAQLELEHEGFPGVVEPGHAVVRYTNPATGSDALPTIRTEMHRLRAGCRTAATRVAGSSVWQIFAGDGEIELEGERHLLETGDLFVVPSWAALSLATETGLDAFRFSDDPVFERLALDRSDRMES